jgi:hypothetical protein
VVPGGQRHGCGMRRPAGAAAHWRAESGSGPKMRLRPATGQEKSFPIKPSPIFYSNLN